MQYLKLENAAQAREVLSFLLEAESASAEIISAVQNILTAVRLEGDAACLRLTQEFDGVALSPATMEISLEERRRARSIAAPALCQALEKAAENIHFYHQKQKPSSWRTERPGVVLEERVLPIDHVGIYIPGGRAKYPSTVLMTAIPAKIAGVQDIVMVSPPDRATGTIAPILLLAAELAGVDRIFRIGGAQAIAALAFGTKTIPAVDKIAGPGNAYVAEAKRQVFGRVGIDMLAGPTEIALLVDGTAPLALVVQDLFAQMEHDPLTRALVVSTDDYHLRKIAEGAEQELERVARHEIVKQAWERNTFFVEANDDAVACAVINIFAPEHLHIMTRARHEWLANIHHAGAIFLGRYSPVVLGDYVAGPNHTLPTNRSARFSSPLGVYDFVRHQHVIEYTREGWLLEKDAVVELARAEELFNHALSAQRREEG
ncbi:MAG: histidinol dehydrogenase [bacterium]